MARRWRTPHLARHPFSSAERTGSTTSPVFGGRVRATMLPSTSEKGMRWGRVSKTYGHGFGREQKAGVLFRFFLFSSSDCGVGSSRESGTCCYLAEQSARPAQIVAMLRLCCWTSDAFVSDFDSQTQEKQPSSAFLWRRFLRRCPSFVKRSTFRFLRAGLLPSPPSPSPF